jgi:hypothetical protein
MLAFCYAAVQLRSCRPQEPELATLLHASADAEYCESLLACIVESFAAAGDAGKVRQMLQGHVMFPSGLKR